jgi:hypothetical protein
VVSVAEISGGSFRDATAHDVEAASADTSAVLHGSWQMKVHDHLGLVTNGDHSYSR